MKRTSCCVLPRCSQNRHPSWPRSLPPPRAKRQFANKYLGSGPKELKLEFVAADVREDISKCIAQASEDRHILGGQLFSSVEKMIFQEIYNVTFKALKKDHADR